jgi:NADPH:quinone reductase-like Zn-dependent oxidoreductase
MKAAVVNILGQAPKYEDFPEPVAAEGEVVVQMRAAGLHPVVKAIASGKHYSSTGQVPLVPGVDGVAILDDGSLAYCVAACRTLGTMAEKTVVRTNFIPLPKGLDPELAAAIANPGMSAWLSLTVRAGLVAGETVLVMGATGVAGRLAVQLARYLGAAKVIAAGRNPEALAAVGADATIALADPEDAISEALTAQVRDGIDVVIDYLWGRPTELLLGALAKGFRPDVTKRTRLVEVGESAGSTISLPGAVLRSIDLTLSGSGFGSVPMDQIMSAIPTLFSLAVEGHLKVAVESVPLAGVEQAWSQIEKGKRIVFAIGGAGEK